MIKNKRANIGTILLPVARGIPQHIAASIGRTIVRHTYLETVLACILCDLLEISVGQGRVAAKLPPAKRCGQHIQILLKFHKIDLRSVSFTALAKTLDRAEIARNTLAHSIIVRSGRSYLLQLVRGTWDLGQEFESVSRALIPEGKPLNRAFLQLQRKLVEDAIHSSERLRRKVQSALKALHEKRHKGGALDRRRNHQTGGTPIAQLLTYGA